MKIFDYKYLTRYHLDGFDNYKYKSIDTSPLSVYVMHPFWNKVVELFPKWVAPNVLTFAGFLLIVFDFLVLSHYDYSYYASSSPAHNVTAEDALAANSAMVPQKLWYLIGALLFIAYTLDGIDGKQARRTGASGPLGELFDHGLDSYTVFFIPACLYSVFGRLDFSVSPLRMYYVMWNLLLNFYLSHWEKYITGVLFLPWGYDFGMWASTILFLWTGAYSTGVYKQYVFGDYTVANVFEWAIYGTGVVTNLPVALYNIYKHYSARQGRLMKPRDALRPFLSLFLIFLLLSMWIHVSDHLIELDLRVLFLLMGTLFSNVACRLIVSQMSGLRCESTNLLTAPLALGGLAAMAWPEHERLVLCALTALCVLAHLHYGCCVVRQMCDHFRMNCFTIKHREE